MMNPISVKDKLPTERQRCLWWHSKHKCWYIGVWYPGVFIGAASGFVFDGIATHWMPEPEAPEGEE